MYAGLNRGIFGVQNARKVEIASLLQLLEAANPDPRPTDNLDKVSFQTLFCLILSGNYLLSSLIDSASHNLQSMA